MVTKELILTLLDAGGADAFEHFGFMDEPRKGLDLPTFALLKDIEAYLQAKKNLEATIAIARSLIQEPHA